MCPLDYRFGQRRDLGFEFSHSILEFSHSIVVSQLESFAIRGGPIFAHIRRFGERRDLFFEVCYSFDPADKSAGERQNLSFKLPYSILISQFIRFYLILMLL